MKGYLPRVCGGVPSSTQIVLGRSVFTPRLRGCTLEDGVSAACVHIYPALAGGVPHAPYC